MSERYKVIDSGSPTFITCTIVDWVDIFTRRKYTNILDESLIYCQQNKGLKIHAYVYMTNHIHLIVSSDKNEIFEIVRDFKKFTNRALIDAIQNTDESRRIWLLNKFAFKAKATRRAENYKVWKDGFHPIILDTPKKLMQRFRYIHYNPIHAGFVNHESDWRNSSYSVYEDSGYINCNLKIDKLF